ncbi:hypothetical protein ScalyP_jg12066 [Parmales sp. scaly parma]|nr:hypothetical protein ScalyP_jg12066 [Parmales sp. scaly parma]
MTTSLEYLLNTSFPPLGLDVDVHGPYISGVFVDSSDQDSFAEAMLEVMELLKASSEKHADNEDDEPFETLFEKLLALFKARNNDVNQEKEERVQLEREKRMVVLQKEKEEAELNIIQMEKEKLIAIEKEKLLGFDEDDSDSDSDSEVTSGNSNKAQVDAFHKEQRDKLKKNAGGGKQQAQKENKEHKDKKKEEKEKRKKRATKGERKA